jgi:hypothetical protein
MALSTLCKTMLMTLFIVSFISVINYYYNTSQNENFVETNEPDGFEIPNIKSIIDKDENKTDVDESFVTDYLKLESVTETLLDNVRSFRSKVYNMADKYKTKLNIGVNGSQTTEEEHEYTSHDHISEEETSVESEESPTTENVTENVIEGFYTGCTMECGPVS